MMGNRSRSSLETRVLVVGEPVELRINAGFGRYVRSIAISMTDKNGKQWEILDAPGRIVAGARGNVALLLPGPPCQVIAASRLERYFMLPGLMASVPVCPTSQRPCS
jgi:hypothetical protein